MRRRDLNAQTNKSLATAETVHSRSMSVCLGESMKGVWAIDKKFKLKLKKNIKTHFYLKL